ncbi:hypothetical protein MRX96_037896 [Rhipicephalus microplus]
MALFERCRSCQAACRVQKETDGRLLRITATCPLQHVWSRESQPMLNRKALSNILLAGAILFSGSNPKKVLRLLSKHWCKLVAASKCRGLKILAK